MAVEGHFRVGGRNDEGNRFQEERLVPVCLDRSGRDVAFHHAEAGQGMLVIG